MVSKWIYFRYTFMFGNIKWPPRWFSVFFLNCHSISFSSNLLSSILSSLFCLVWVLSNCLLSTEYLVLIIFQQTHSLTLLQVESHFLNFFYRFQTYLGFVFLIFHLYECSAHLSTEKSLHILLMLHDFQISYENI